MSYRGKTYHDADIPWEISVKTSRSRNKWYYIRNYSHASAGAGSADSGWASGASQAHADPFVYVDPNWEYAPYFYVVQPTSLDDSTPVEITRNWEYPDGDGDGYTSVEDCNDTDSAVNPGAGEVCDDGIDNDCDSYVDASDIDCGLCADTDADNVCDDVDNCPGLYNPDQRDFDSDGIGYDCDTDYDNDGVENNVDNCLFVANPDQADSDGDGTGDVCQDSDGDNVFDIVDNCLGYPNYDQADMDGDGKGDKCDSDADGDGYEKGFGPGKDCGDLDPTTYPGATEICDDGTDNDCDGHRDSADPDCIADYDNDGLTKHEEEVFGTNPLLEDTDGDGVDDLNDAFPLDSTEQYDSDGTEIQITTDPSDQSFPSISGDRIVWKDKRNGNWDIYMYDLSTGIESQITTDTSDQGGYGPSISGDRIVYADGRNGNSDIYMYDLSTGIETQITSNTSTSYQGEPAFSGDRIVYVDTRNGCCDIYMYDLSTGTESQITPFYPSIKGYPAFPSISGDRIVWEDYRNGPMDIYMYDLSTGTESRITSDTSNQCYAAISGDRIVWEEWEVDINIYMYDLSTGIETQITSNTSYQGFPAISGNRIVWHDSRNGNSDIYMYDLSTGIETQITSNTSSQDIPAISGNRIVWRDYRNGNGDIYMYAGDGVGDNSDNCQAVYNPDQADTDSDGIGDVCDPDIDGDGIFNAVDTDQYIISSDFNDFGLGGTTYGVITDNGDQTLEITEAANPDGVRIKSLSGGAVPATVSACGGSSVITINQGDEVIVTCSSVTVDVINGTVEIVFIANDGTTASVSLTAGNSMSFDPGSLTVTVPPENTETVIVVVGGSSISISPGETVSLIDQDGDGYNIVVDCDDNNASVNPGASETCNGIDDNCDGQVDEIYVFGGFQQPINTDDSSIFKAGRTIPVKVTLADCSGVNVSTATVTIAVYKITDAVLGTDEELDVEASGNANTGNQFRYDDTDGLYIFNLSTKGYTVGTYRVDAKPDDGSSHSVMFSLK